MDRLSRQRRSWLMSRVKGRDTSPELVIRKKLHALGYRYRLHVKSLPGRPDIVFGPRRKIVLIHGCFWHGHNCRKARLPKSNTAFWREKMEKNKARDRKTIRRLRALGWKVLVVWQCRIKNSVAVEQRIVDFLE